MVGGTHRLLGTVFCIGVSIASCSDDGARSAGDPPQRTHAETTAIALRLAAPDASAAKLLRSRTDAWKKDGASFTSPGSRALDSRHRLAARMPTFADAPIEVGFGRFERFQVALSPIGARHAGGVIEDGRVVYGGVFESTDALFVTDDDRVEGFFVLHDARSPNEIAWSVSVGRGLPATRFEESGALVFVDARGEGVLRVPPPFAVDARGTRREATLAYDGATLRVLLDMAGLAYPVLLDPAVETVVWAKQTPATSPGVRIQAGLVYDSTRKEMLLFGGMDPNELNETWAWDGTTWTQRMPASSPTPRAGMGFAFDDARGKAVVFGGNPNNLGTVVLSDTWEWDGSNWTRRTPTTSPTARSDHAMAYDGGRHVTVLFGGCGVSTLSSCPTAQQFVETWEWDGTNWTKRAPATSPPWSSSLLMTYDTTRHVTTLVTGASEVWTWDGTTWTKMTTTGMDPRVAISSSFAFDGARGRGVQFGGLGLDAQFNSIALADTWEWDGAGWKLQTIATHPPGRIGPSAAWSATQRLVVFGGNGSANNVSYLKDTWVYYARGGACTTDAACDTGHCVDGVCCETACGACQACNLATKPGQCTPIVNTEDPDSCKGKQTCDAMGACKPIDGQACANDDACASGRCADSICCTKGCAGKCLADTGTCVATGVCDGDHTLTSTDGRTPPTNCTPFKCDVLGGACLTRCTSVDQCAAPNVCDGTSCIAPPSNSAGDSSGGCVLATRESTGLGNATAIFGILAAGAAIARRRKSGRHG